MTKLEYNVIDKNKAGVELHLYNNGTYTIYVPPEALESLLPKKFKKLVEGQALDKRSVQWASGIYLDYEPPEKEKGE